MKGQLPPGAERQLAMTLTSLHEAVAGGVQVRVAISAGPGCEVSAALAKLNWPVGQEPSLPIPGCIRSPCCACCYTPWFPDSEPVTPEQAAETEGELQDVLDRLPPAQATEIRRLLEAALASFNIIE